MRPARLVAAALLAASPASSAPDGAHPGDVVAIDPELQRAVWPVPQPATDRLRAEDWPAAVAALRAVPLDGLVGDQKSAWAFLVAWAAVHTDHPEQALDVLPLLAPTPAVPDAWGAAVRGELLLAAGKAEEALVELAKVDAASAVGPRAAMAAHEALRGLGREQEAWERVEALVARPDPAPGNAAALLALARRAGLESPVGRGHALRIQVFYPGTPEDEAVKGLGTSGWTWQERARRAEGLANAGQWQAAIELTAGITDPEAKGSSIDACRLRYVRGRSLTKKNAQSEAAAVLADVASACAGVEGDYGAKGAYLLGQALHRRKAYAEAAAAYRALAETFPASSVADDGLTKAGAALLEVGRDAEARALWERALTEFPTGDTVPEALLRLAFARYEAGDPADAIAVAEQLAALPLDGDGLRVVGGKYWAARWRMYPTASAPSKATTDATARAEAIAGWTAVCEQHPQSFYALLSAARLYEVAPAVAAALARPDPHDRGEEPVAWSVRASTLRDARFRDAISLLRLSLANEGLAELALDGVGEWTPDERAWVTGLRIEAGDWLFAHDEMRRWLTTHPIGTLGEHERRIVRVAYPDRYWEQVRASVKPGWHYEPRLFHALVREESNFNREIVSFAGAHGLSQLMPATAQQTAGWLGMKVTTADLRDPVTNLTIGARYLEAMHTQLGNSPYLALAAYNGGAGNVNKWLTAEQNPPTDEFVENIPFDETRGYVTRVMGTWQVYRWQFDEDAPPFPDLSAFNHRAKP